MSEIHEERGPRAPVFKRTAELGLVARTAAFAAHHDGSEAATDVSHSSLMIVSRLREPLIDISDPEDVANALGLAREITNDNY